MKGTNRRGESVEHSPRKARPVPPGKLSHRQVADLQEVIVAGLKGQGYTVDQVAQILSRSPRTIARRSPESPPPYV